MKNFSVTAFLTIALSVVVWMFFYIMTPDAPLSPQETVLVVGICAVVVFLAKRAWSKLHKKGDKNG